MTKLEDYLDKINNKELEDSIFNKYKDFDYDDEDIFQFDLEFLINNIYNIKIVETKLIDLKQKRMGQQEFRQKVLELYGSKCIVSGNDCPAELEAAHIVPFSEQTNYDLSNSLLLERNLHSTFDKYLWSINPETFMIEVKDNCGSIKKYEGKILNLNDDLKFNLREHYSSFKHLYIA
jgi:predicted restriction endonuclease